MLTDARHTISLLKRILYLKIEDFSAGIAFLSTGRIIFKAEKIPFFISPV